MRAPRGLIAIVFGLLLPVGCAPGEGGGPTTGTAGSTTGTAGSTTGTADHGTGGAAGSDDGATGGRRRAPADRRRRPAAAPDRRRGRVARPRERAAPRPAPAARRPRRGAAAAQAARRDAAGRAGRPGVAAAAAAVAEVDRPAPRASSGAAGAGAGDAYVSGVTVTVHAQTRTILVVTWTQAMAAEQTFLEFSFAGSGLMTSRAQPGATGAHRDVVLGVPASTAVTLRIVSRQGGVDYKTRDYMGTTGALPTGMPLPQVLSYNAALASPDRWHVRRGRGLDRRLHRRQLLLRPGVLGLHHGPPGPHRLVLRRRRQQRRARRFSASPRTANTSGSRRPARARGGS